MNPFQFVNIVIEIEKDWLVLLSSQGNSATLEQRIEFFSMLANGYASAPCKVKKHTLVVNVVNELLNDGVGAPQKFTNILRNPANVHSVTENSFRLLDSVVQPVVQPVVQQVVEQVVEPVVQQVVENLPLIDIPKVSVGVKPEVDYKPLFDRLSNPSGNPSGDPTSWTSWVMENPGTTTCIVAGTVLAVYGLYQLYQYWWNQPPVPPVTPVTPESGTAVNTVTSSSTGSEPTTTIVKSPLEAYQDFTESWWDCLLEAYPNGPGGGWLFLLLCLLLLRLLWRNRN